MKLFGTDGIRGLANQEPMTIQTIMQVGRAAACVFKNKIKHQKHKVVIGKDTRLSGYMFETAMASGLCSMGVDVMLTGPLPTPAIAYITQSMRVDAGVMISASHNPYQDNGIKFFNEQGFKLDDDLEKAIEQLVLNPTLMDLELPKPSHIGKAKRMDDARGRYIVYLKHHFAMNQTLEGLKLVIDCANGATYKIAPDVFSELGADCVVIGNKPDGKNINEMCGALNLESLKNAVLQESADLGIAYDGDGDRVMLIDHQGHVFDGDDVLALLSLTLNESTSKKVVGTVMSNFGLEKYFQNKKIEFLRSDVGDRYVLDMMKKTNSVLGGEPSGHIIALNKSTTGDGILSSLLVLNVLVQKQKRLADFYGMFERYPQILKNIRVTSKPPLEGIASVKSAIDHAKKKLERKGRVLVRYSGTENKARVMVEGDNHDVVQSLVDEISTEIQKAIGAR